ncbi:probable tRNA N6-adenosine threonylcarbamoyltransferase, mitochondrial [Galendromus occidentalis]|uniref:N(6)-L-threonylcarbamoyladenine synthase n=1 Tax=Galendromus occidentalis TaxID=34638 RepID=A0AAJ6QL97_9ACAR|nr:probable tRNA N6-adenosine threonylcarbamoyltransferase, mitochondrial [Galendromus occidentalis]
MLPSFLKVPSITGAGLTSSGRRSLLRYLHHSTKRKLVLGIETSCDDTGMAIVDEAGNILGEAHHSQLRTHVRFGGVLPPLARDLHRQNIAKVHSDTLKAAGVDPREIDAVAVTTRPGMALSLGVGLEHAKKFCKENSLPLIPIHHMEAHALVVRCENRSVDLPYLVLLVSGGHSQVAVVRDVTDFALLGSTIDDAPGEALDKIARRLKLSNLREFRELSGGASVELLAKRGDPRTMKYHQPLSDRKDCNFSFSGFKSMTTSQVMRLEKGLGIRGDAILPNAADICASVQYYMCLHIMKRVFRAIMFCRRKGIDFGDRLVISGGVACSLYLRAFMRQLCEAEDVELFVPPPRLCSDNGVMIAWNGVERLRVGEKPKSPHELDELGFEPSCSLGEDLREQVSRECIRIPRFKIDLVRLLTETGNIHASGFPPDRGISPKRTSKDLAEQIKLLEVHDSEDTKTAELA